MMLKSEQCNFQLKTSPATQRYRVQFPVDEIVVTCCYFILLKLFVSYSSDTFENQLYYGAFTVSVPVFITSNPAIRSAKQFEQNSTQ